MTYYASNYLSFIFREENRDLFRNDKNLDFYIYLSNRSDFNLDLNSSNQLIWKESFEYKKPINFSIEDRQKLFLKGGIYQITNETSTILNKSILLSVSNYLIKKIN